VPYQTGLAQALRSVGLGVVEHPGWETRGSSSFTPKGLVAHHTAIADTNASVRVCVDGRPDLPGPLCQVVLSPEGTCHVIAAGRANHAGPGGWKGLSGNSLVWGVEAVHSGVASQPWPSIQLEAYRKAGAAMLRLVGIKNAGYLCGHKEWTTRKIDPISLDMNQFRAAVQGILDGGGTEVDMDVPVDALADPRGGVWVLSKDGAVRAFRGARYLGATNGKDYWGDREAKALEPVGDAYAIIATSNEKYGPGF
jgi:hypothetical protein